MKKYMIIHFVTITLLLSVYGLMRDSSYRFGVQIACFFGTGGVVAISMYIVRDRIMRLIKKIDFKAYQQLNQPSKRDPVFNVNIDDSYPYNEETQSLLRWWNIYLLLSWVTDILAFVLLFLSR